MHLRNFGRTDIYLPAIGQGTTGTGPLATRDEAKDRHRIRVLQQGIELGMNFIDTAELYGGGHGEELAGKAIAGRRSQVFLASKFNPANNRPDDIERALCGSLQRLGTDYLDLYQMHWPNPAVPIEETLAGMTHLVEKGLVRYIGLSNVSLPELKQACKITKIESVQLEYNLTDRSIEADILPFCKQHGITVLAFSPLDRGRDYGAIPTLERLSLKYNKTLSQVMLNWVIAHESVIALTMTTNPGHLSEAAAAAGFRMDPEDISALEKSTECAILQIPPREIRVMAGSSLAYANLDEALANSHDLIPYPVELAESIRKYGIEKPIRVRRLSEPNSPEQYLLMGGYLRFWAWVIAYGWECPVPAYDIT
jgi:aryl-alcohol dehydrogenase-like predicted oxidoreductase